MVDRTHNQALLSDIGRGTCLLSVLLLIAVFLGAVDMHAQMYPTENTREELVDALNIQLATGTDGPVPWPGYGSESIFYLDPFDPTAVDGCVEASSMTLDMTFSGSTFTVTRTLNSASTPESTPWANHDLGVDLNGWLNAMWGLPMHDEDVFGPLAWQCGTEDYRFFTEREVRNSSDPNVPDASFDAMIQEINDVTGASAMLDKVYLIDGVWRSGSDILKITYGEAGTGGEPSIEYMVDRGDPVDQTYALPRRYLAFARLEIDIDDDGLEDFTLDIDLQTTPYPDPCGISTDEELAVTEGDFTVDAVIDVNDYAEAPGPLSPPAEHCKWGWYINQYSGGQFDTYTAGYFSNPDSSSKRMFRYIEEHRGEWRPNRKGNVETEGAILQLGAFFTQDDGSGNGNLVFERYTSGCCYGTSEIVGRVESYSTIPEEVCAATFCRGGSFFLDPDRNMIYYSSPTLTDADGPYNEECTPCGKAGITIPQDKICAKCDPPAAVPLLCVEFCDALDHPSETVDLTIRSDARTFSDEIPVVDEQEYLLLPTKYARPSEYANDFERGRRGKWRVSSEHVFRSDIKGGTTLFGEPDNRVYEDAGTYERRCCITPSTLRSAPFPIQACRA